MTVARVRMLRCPHCEAPARKSSSRPVTRLVRDEYYSCSDVEDCGFTFKVQLSITTTLTPSRRPRAGVAIPFGVSRPPPPALPLPANDTIAAVLSA